MRLSISTWSFHWALRRKRLTLFECAEQASRMRLHGIELLDMHFPSTAKRTLANLSKKIKELGLLVPVIALSNDFGLPTNRQRLRSRDQVLRWIDRCAELDAGGVRIFPGWPSLGNPLMYEKERARLWPEMIAHIKRCAVHAEAAGKKLFIENHDHGGFARTAEDMLRLMNEVGSPTLEFLLNTGDYLVDTPARNGYPALEALAHRAGMVHAVLYELDQEGRCTRQDYGRILDILTAAGFQGFLSIEYEGAPDMAALERGTAYLVNELERRGISEIK